VFTEKLSSEYQEGTIGTEVSQKIYDVLMEYEDKIVSTLDYLEKDRYEALKTAFRTASEDGLVWYS
jgi:hypothetical protein